MTSIKQQIAKQNFIQVFNGTPHTETYYAIHNVVENFTIERYVKVTSKKYKAVPIIFGTEGEATQWIRQISVCSTDDVEGIDLVETSSDSGLRIAELLNPKFTLKKLVPVDLNSFQLHYNFWESVSRINDVPFKDYIKKYGSIACRIDDDAFSLNMNVGELEIIEYQIPVSVETLSPIVQANTASMMKFISKLTPDLQTELINLFFR